ncbi:MAG: HYExAFE family protein [Planctomycetes bacterium]|nr:HYExAFE family protein [Planctomycetota bacterium]
MAQRRFHYEQAFEHYLRANRVPYVAVDEAKKSLMPAGQSPKAIKSFDFVVYAPGRNLLVDVKGRMYGSATGRSRQFESWVTDDDIRGLQRWQKLFGPGFEAVFVFAYCLRRQPPDALFEELFEFGTKWYALREVRLDAYSQSMVRRSSKWRTVYVPAEAFKRISQPFSARRPQTIQPACDAADKALC